MSIRNCFVGAAAIVLVLGGMRPFSMEARAALWNLSLDVSSFGYDMTYLGVSRKHAGAGTSPSATVDYNLDNIRLSQGGTIIYAQDFSSDPGWTTDDPTELKWDPSTDTFHGTQANGEHTSAYKVIPALDPNQSWRLEFDHKMNSCDWSAGLTFGLFDASLLLGPSASFDQSVVDLGHNTGLFGYYNGTGAYSPVWTTGVWYHSTMEYDATAGRLTLLAEESAVPEPTAFALWTSLGVMSIVIGWRRRKPAA